jgi:hypothetical protein
MKTSRRVAGAVTSSCLRRRGGAAQRCPKGCDRQAQDPQEQQVLQEEAWPQNWCKNQYNADRRRRLSNRGAEDARKGLHMQNTRVGEWDKLTSSLKKVYDGAYRAVNQAT